MPVVFCEVRVLGFTSAGVRKLVLLGCVFAAITALASSSDDLPKKATTKPAHPAGKITKAHSSKKGKKSRRTASSRRGQQKIDSARAQQIQEALIREHYLTGSPSRVWDDRTQQALQKYQADNGWQAKTTPDARALIKLGLGPDHEHLLNPESAMTSQPQTRSSPSPKTSSGDEDPANQPQR